MIKEKQQLYNKIMKPLKQIEYYNSKYLSFKFCKIVS